MYYIEENKKEYLKMKKILLTLLFFTSLSFAETATLNPDQPRFRDILKSRAKDFVEKKMEKDSVKKITVEASKKVAKKGAIFVAEGVVAKKVVGAVAKTAYKHKVAIGVTALVGAGLYDISNKTENEQYEEMVNSTLFASLSNELMTEFDKVNTAYENDARIKICTKQLAEKYLVNTSPPNFELNINQSLPQTTARTLFNVNTYKKNIASYTNYRVSNISPNTTDPHEQDHIPSYYALEDFFGISHIPNIRNYNLNNNATTMDILKRWHKKGRTYGKKNTKDKRNIFGVQTAITPKYKKDGNNLDLATRKDLIIMAYIIAKNGSASDLLNFKTAAIELYTRNKLLCLYDI